MDLRRTYKELREGLSMTQTQVAEEAGIPASSVSRAESGYMSYCRKLDLYYISRYGADIISRLVDFEEGIRLAD